MSIHDSVFTKPRFYRELLSAVAMLMLLLLPATAFTQVSVTIEDYFDAEPGHNIPMEITLQNYDSLMALGGFDLRIDYDASVLTLMNVTSGWLFNDCDWEYFTYRIYTEGIRGVGIVGIADINNGAHHPDCYFEGVAGVLAVLEFHVASDSVYSGQAVPVRFVWTDCGNNAFSNVSGDTLLLSRYVYDWFDHTPIHANDTMPTYNGAPDACLGGNSTRMVDYYSGKVTINEEPFFERGDLNLNGIPNEIADYVLFANYFLYGLSVFDINPEAQIAASDVNADGLVLTVRDYIYLYRIIIGDALPYPKAPIDTIQGDTAVFAIDLDAKTVTLEYSDSLAAAYLVFDGDIIPTLAGGAMTLDYAFTDSTTRVLIYPFSGKPVITPGLLLTYTGTGTLVYAEVADYYNAMIPTGIVETGGGSTHVCGDVDCSGDVDIDDVVYLLIYIILGGPEPCADCPL